MPSTDASTPTPTAAPLRWLSTLYCPKNWMVLSARAQDADLQTAHQSEAVFEADHRAAIEAEKVFGQVAEVVLARVAA